MNYQQSLHYLNSFTDFEKEDWNSKNLRWNLSRMRYLLRLFGSPQKHFFSVLIAGTKGKGSTGFFLESILGASSIRSGFYNSPHLIDARERIRLQGNPISKRGWAGLVSQIARRLKAKGWPQRLGRLTYFELTTLLALMAFREAKVSVGILEVGMGGRLDATNAFASPLVLLTPIHFDHEVVLGPTLSAIAREKAAVIHPKSWVVTGPQKPEARKVIQKRVAAQKAFVRRAKPIPGSQVSVLGDYQKLNAALAATGAGLLERVFNFPVKPSYIRTGIARLKHLPGRFEILKARTSYLIDGAHNPASIEAFVQSLKRKFPKSRRILILGVARDKQLRPMLRSLASYFKEVIVTEASHPRAKPLPRLMASARDFFDQIYPASTMAEALQIARMRMGAKGLVVATGSFYLAGEIKQRLSHAGY